ncbi:hypothetical protein F5J12DRAFT_785389 [Pisolithus orientalis]|uniref:uncharacterized protein n=1 Tax=Pisolithus orientalis TaxID=936130 RepID=UPI002225978F|nr:uncharacterized protein F5J12DRAFT_785389 [Pisolithus orientalis]KAI5996608.1 hypothetical protein F5J12DRAFT_785389 [Pisolithus orientalis]
MRSPWTPPWVLSSVQRSAQLRSEVQVVVAEGPSPTRQEVLGNDADLHSQEEVTGGQMLSSIQMDTINALLWDTAERVKKQQRRAHQGYLVSGPSTFVINHTMTGDEGFEEDKDALGEDKDALGEDNDVVSPEHMASHEDAQGFTVGKPPGKST